MDLTWVQFLAPTTYIFDAKWSKDGPRVGPPAARAVSLALRMELGGRPNWAGRGGPERALCEAALRRRSGTVKRAGLCGAG
ncbi:unnamed protein product [Linum trigynum]|uniref:Uncharacterized protein n=1 Tax=Linum trigynum TaxID=586398 RepID=A0AAV2G9W2_9ROSI